jgi:hypothetical protein
MFSFDLLTFIISAFVARTGKGIKTLLGGSIEEISAQFRKLSTWLVSCRLKMSS